MDVQHFLTLKDIPFNDYTLILQRAMQLKRERHEGKVHQTLNQKTLAMIFEKSSTRTRVSFEAGMIQLGGQALFLSPRDTQLGRGEPVSDSAQVISSMVDCIMIRTFDHQIIEDFAKHSAVPIINGLTDDHHPCQLLADLLTITESGKDLTDLKVTFLGDVNNMCQSYIEAAQVFGFQLTVCCPQPLKEKIAMDDNIQWIEKPQTACLEADVIVTDVWASMGEESESENKRKLLRGYQVTKELLSLAKKDVIFLHCLPAHEGEEIESGLLNHSASMVWQEAENRLHSQKALLEYLIGDPRIYKN